MEQVVSFSTSLFPRITPGNYFYWLGLTSKSYATSEVAPTLDCQIGHTLAATKRSCILGANTNQLYHSAAQIWTEIYLVFLRNLSASIIYSARRAFLDIDRPLSFTHSPGTPFLPDTGCACTRSIKSLERPQTWGT